MTTSKAAVGIGAESPEHARPVHGIIARIAAAAMRAPKITLAIAAALLVVSGALGSTLTEKLSAGGFLEPDTEGSRAAAVLAEHFGLTSMQMVFTVTGPAGATGQPVIDTGRRIATELRAEHDVAGVLTPWDGTAAGAALRSTDGTIAAIIVSLHGNDNQAMNTSHRLAERFTGSDSAVTVAAGGPALAYYEVNHKATEDGSRAEMITLPLSLLLLALLLRSAVAAAIPVAAGFVAIGGTVGLLTALSTTTDVSVFAVNASAAMGLALSIDYALLIINRFREYLDDGSEQHAAILLAVQSSGRAVVFSGITLALSLLGAMFFPMGFVRSMSIAGIAVVTLSVVLALTCVPALLVLFGERVERRRNPGRPVQESRFYRIARFAQRRPILVTIVIVGSLLGLGTPMLGIRFGLPDDRVLPRDAAVHQVGDTLRERFPVQLAGTIYVAMPHVSPQQMAGVREYATAISQLPGVTGVTGTVGNYGGGAQLSAPAEAIDGPAYLAVATPLDPNTTAGKDLLGAVHALPEPTEVLVGGLAQQNADIVGGIRQAFPRALAWIVISSFLLLLLLTGSVLLPLKAVVLNSLSLSASFGALVWVFQQGHLGGFGTVTTGVTVCTIPIVLFCSTFGLSMDYEVFLLSRFKEEWQASGRTRADNDRAVAIGIARSGRVITAAAVVMVVAFSGLIASGIAVNRVLGVGMTLAILLDATVIRLFLVPAVMRLAGTWNWWAPAPLRPLLAKFQLQH
ncbi:MMPL family transporter [Nocardia sp. NPDC058058]|uniref:MMPL family transporter n=1 Tax=Nocardia sp. NPDC058058 TaxID=3346317 RepID=UPI0036D93EE1